MSWVVDTCVLLDIFEADPDFAVSSADAMDRLGKDGLAIAPVSYIELAPAFHGDHSAQDEFLSELGIELDFGSTRDAVLAAHKAWNEHIARKRTGNVPRRPIADAMIGAYALQKGGLLTRNPSDFRSLFPRLRIETP